MPALIDLQWNERTGMVPTACFNSDQALAVTHVQDRFFEIRKMERRWHGVNR